MKLLLKILGAASAALCLIGAMTFAFADKEPEWAHCVVGGPRGFLAVCEWGGDGVATSRDDGRSWKRTSTPPLKELVLDPSGTLWGFYAWGGIHEPSSASLVMSKDQGASFVVADLDAEAYLPVALLRQPGAKPLLLLSSGELWIHVAGAPQWVNWRRVYDAPSGTGRAVAGLMVERGYYLAREDEVLYRDLRDPYAWAISTTSRVTAFARALDQCFAAAVGEILVTKCGSNDWRLLTTLPDVSRIFAMEPVGQDLYVVGQTHESYAFAARISESGALTVLPSLPGAQIVGTGLDSDQRVLTAGQGVHRLVGNSWSRIWPSK